MFTLYCSKHPCRPMLISGNGNGYFCRVCDEAYCGIPHIVGVRYCYNGELYEQNPEEEERDE